MAHDELEALHLCDGKGMTQEEAGACMGVSRGTVQRLLANARGKVAQALAGQKALAISASLTEQVAATPGAMLQSCLARKESLDE